MKEPLRKVIFNNNLLNDRIYDRLDDKEKTALQRSTDGARRMQTLIDDILSYSQTAFGDHTKEEVDMNVILENVISNLNEVIEETGDNHWITDDARDIWHPAPAQPAF